MPTSLKKHQEGKNTVARMSSNIGQPVAQLGALTSPFAQALSDIVSLLITNYKGYMQRLEDERRRRALAAARKNRKAAQDDKNQAGNPTNLGQPPAGSPAPTRTSGVPLIPLRPSGQQGVAKMPREAFRQTYHKIRADLSRLTSDTIVDAEWREVSPNRQVEGPTKPAGTSPTPRLGFNK